MSALRRSISNRCNGGTRDRLPPTRFFRGSVMSFTIRNIKCFGQDRKLAPLGR
jgi:hypothetical protein